MQQILDMNKFRDQRLDPLKTEKENILYQKNISKKKQERNKGDHN